MTATMSNWNQCPTKQLSKVIRPKILKMDSDGCENIKKRIGYEKVIEEMERMWKIENRVKIRCVLDHPLLKLSLLFLPNLANFEI